MTSFGDMGNFVTLSLHPKRLKTNILSDRLKWLEESGIIEKEAYQSRPTRYFYSLTEKGRDLLPVLQAMAGVWGKRISKAP